VGKNKCKGKRVRKEYILAVHRRRKNIFSEGERGGTVFGPKYTVDQRI
jgi:hypothetical protein